MVGIRCVRAPVIVMTVGIAIVGGCGGRSLLEGGNEDATGGTPPNAAGAPSQAGAGTANCPPAFTGTRCELPRLEEIGIVPHAYALALSADGSTVVGVLEPFAPTHAFLWTRPGGAMPIESMTFADAVDGTGQLVVGSWGTQPVRWTLATGAVSLPEPSFVSSGTGGNVRSVSFDGNVVVGTFSNLTTGSVAYRWTEAAGYEILDRDCMAFSVSADGEVAVGRCGGTASTAARWSPAGFRTLSPLPGDTCAAALAVSADGASAVGASGTDVTDCPMILRAVQGRPVLFSDEGTIALPLLPGDGAWIPQSVDATGSVVVGLSHEDAVIWDRAGGARRVADELARRGVDTAGWTLRNAVGVSADGKVVVGNGIGRTGDMNPWIARLH
jgi:uncharacterized membrane protein